MPRPQFAGPNPTGNDNPIVMALEKIGTQLTERGGSGFGGRPMIETSPQSSGEAIVSVLKGIASQVARIVSLLNALPASNVALPTTDPAKDPAKQPTGSLSSATAAFAKMAVDAFGLSSVGNAFSRVIDSGVQGSKIGGQFGKLFESAMPTTSPGAAGGAAAEGEGAAAAEGAAGGAAGMVVGGLVGGVSQLFAELKNGLLAFGDIAVQTVSKMSPVTVERYMRAWDDLWAEFGFVLQPVVETMTQGVRLLADTLATMAPSTDEVRQALLPLTKLFDDWRESLGENAGRLRAYGKDLLNVFGMIVEALAWLAKKAGQAFAAFQYLFGMNAAEGDDEKGLRSSFGASARRSSFTSVDAYAKSVYSQAYSSGTQSRSESLLSGIHDELKQVVQNTAKVADNSAKPPIDTQSMIRGH